MNKSSNEILSFLGMIYVIISQIMALYFWYEWAKDPEHGFLSTILLGPIVGEIKGLLWIFFVW